MQWSCDLFDLYKKEKRYNTHFCIFFFFFVNKQGCLDLFKYLTILSGVCSFSVPHALSQYKEESRGVAPKCRQEILNSRSHGYHVIHTSILKITESAMCWLLKKKNSMSIIDFQTDPVISWHKLFFKQIKNINFWPYANY